MLVSMYSLRCTTLFTWKETENQWNTPILPPNTHKIPYVPLKYPYFTLKHEKGPRSHQLKFFNVFCLFCSNLRSTTTHTLSNRSQSFMSNRGVWKFGQFSTAPPNLSVKYKYHWCKTLTVKYNMKIHDGWQLWGGISEMRCPHVPPWRGLLQFTQKCWELAIGALFK
jgi:hypothetical protein